jgi:hypothetical protein
MSEELRAQITVLAKASNRSMNTEIVLLLQEALQGRSRAFSTVPDGGIDIDALAEALAVKLEARRKA